MAIDLARTATSLITPPVGRERPSEQFLVGFRQSMLDRFRDRNDDFDTLVNAWHGTYYQTSGRAWNIDAAGKPILRLWDRQMSDLPVPHNIYKGFVAAYPLSVSAEWPDKGAYTSFRTRTDLSPTGVATQGGRDDGLSSIQHSIYLDEHWFIRMIGDDIVAEDFHDLGFCPALIPPLF